MPPSPPIRNIFSSLSGSWSLTRTLNSALPNFPSGTFAGTATLIPHASFEGSSYLYHELGTLTTDTGLTLRADKKYIYAYTGEKMSIWFAKETATGKSDEDGVLEGELEPDYLYLDLEFEMLEGRWVARGDHLCGRDMYWAVFDFRMDEAEKEVVRWGLRTKVMGPEKEYTSDTAFRREGS